MNHRTNLALYVHAIETESDPLLDPFDELVAHAADGDRRAVGAIAIAFGPDLLAAAEDVLGPCHRADAVDVLQRLFLDLCEKSLHFPRIRGGGLPWLRRTVRGLARMHLRETAAPDDVAE